MLKLSKVWKLMLAVVLVAALTGCAAAADPVRLNLTTASNTGVYYIMGAGMAKVLNDHLQDRMVVTAEATEGGVANIRLFNNGQSDTSIIASDVVNDAILGQGVFQTPTELMGLMSLHKSYQHFVVLADSEIQSVTDLAGKAIVTGEAGSGNEMKNKAVLQALGYSYEDIEPLLLSPQEGSDALRDGQADVLMLALGIPATAVMSLASELDVRLLSLTEEQVKTVCTALPYFGPITIPGGTYDGVPNDVNSFSQRNLFVCRPDISEDDAYIITKTLLDNWSEMMEVHASAADVTLQEAPNMNLEKLPLHPGAIKYYKEKGLF